MAACEGTEGSHGHGRRDVLQARLPHLRRRGKGAAGKPEKGVLRGRRSRAGRQPPRLRLRPGKRHRPDVLLRRLGCSVRRVRRDHREAHRPGGLRRRHRPRLHRGSTGYPENQAQGRLQRGCHRPRLRSRRAGDEAGLRHHLPAGSEQLQDRRASAPEHRHQKQRPARIRQNRPDRGADYPEIHPVQLRVLCL